MRNAKNIVNLERNMIKEGGKGVSSLTNRIPDLTQETSD